MFDILILVAEKDYNKLPFVCESVVKNIKGYNKIYIIHQSVVPNEYIHLDVNYVSENEILDFDFNQIQMVGRRGWYKQQFIKLLQEITVDNYLVIDADVWINRPIDVNPGLPVFYLGKNQYHRPYFQLMTNLFGIGREFPHSFISEIMLMKRGMVQYMLTSFGLTKLAFLGTCIQAINEMKDASGFSEYELYGNYVTKAWPNAYGYKPLKVISCAKKRVWERDELKQHIETYGKTNADILTMHSWL